MRLLRCFVHVAARQMIMQFTAAKLRNRDFVAFGWIAHLLANCGAFCQYSQCTVDWLLRAIFGDSTLFVRHVLCSRMIYITGFHHGNRFGVVLRVQPSQQPKPPEFKSYQPTWWTEPSQAWSIAVSSSRLAWLGDEMGWAPCPPRPRSEG